jgi:uncharacterized protein YciU (UPF0263 family)
MTDQSSSLVSPVTGLERVSESSVDPEKAPEVFSKCQALLTAEQQEFADVLGHLLVCRIRKARLTQTILENSG